MIKTNQAPLQNADDYAKLALNQSYQHCLTFPWINEKIVQKELVIHVWFFDIKTGQIFTYSDTQQTYQPLTESVDDSSYLQSLIDIR